VTPVRESPICRALAPEPADRSDQHRITTVIGIPKPKARSAVYRSRRRCCRSLPTVGGDRQGNGHDRNTADHQKGLSKLNSSPAGMGIGPIGASRSSEREVFGTGSLLEVRADQRSSAISPGPRSPPLPYGSSPCPKPLGGYPHSCRRSWWSVDAPTRKRPQKTVTIVMTVTPTRTPLTQAVSSVTITVTVG
jgi:hypothetical protein